MWAALARRRWQGGKRTQFPRGSTHLNAMAHQSAKLCSLLLAARHVATPKSNAAIITAYTLRQAKYSAFARAPASKAALVAVNNHKFRPGTRQLSSNPPGVPNSPAEKPPKPPLATRIKEEFQHYVQGSKLLWLEARLSARYLARLVRGEKLSRREHLQLRRTVADMFRLVPFLVLVAIPFAELALPVLLRFFPNMLPSTFEKKFEREEKRRRLLRLRVELARFLQDTAPAPQPTSTQTSTNNSLLSNTRAGELTEFTEFFHTVRKSGSAPSTDALVRIAARFDDEATLESLSHAQLRTMCKYMGINAFGTDPFLRYMLRSRMRRLHADDMMIRAEGGAKTLTPSELRRACTERGLATTDAILTDEASLRAELQQWLDWHIDHKVPASILILTRAFSIPTTNQQQKKNEASVSSMQKTETAAAALAKTLESLPETLVSDAEFKHSETASSESYRKRISLIQEEERMITEERERELELERAIPAPFAPAGKRENTKATTPLAEPSSTSAKSTVDPAIDVDDVRELGEAIKVLASASSVDEERRELAALLPQSTADKKFQKNTDTVDQSTAASGSIDTEAPSQSSPAVERLLRKVQRDLDDYERDVGSRLNLIRAASDGSVSAEDLARALAAVRSEPQSDVVQRIVRVLDVDGDGRVGLSELLAYVDQLDEQEGHGVVIDEKGSASASAGSHVVPSPDSTPSA